VALSLPDRGERGAAFLLLYMLMVAIIGLPIMLAEFAIGRGAKRSPIEALTHFGGRRWRPLGYLFVTTGFIVLAYYGVIAGWVVRYTWIAVAEGFGADAAARFTEVSTGADAVLLQVLFMAATMAIVMGGVKRGIERTALLLMPLLFLVVVGLAVYAATLPGAAAGYGFYLRPQLAEILSLRVLGDAAGQAFFSMSLGMGAMLTFASYLSRDDHLPNQSLVIAGSDFMVAFVAGLMLFPLIFALGLVGEIGESTVGALFITLPQAFGEMGAPGRIVGSLFFAALLFGALTSAISLLEVVTSSFIDTFGWERARAALLAGVGITALGVPAALDLSFLGLLDHIAGNVFLLVGALFLSLFTGWRMTDPVGEVSRGAHGIRWFGLWRFFLCFVAPAFLLMMLMFGLGDLVVGAAG
jgi:neurotransmitter:Na+ symporter, NSS family